MTHSTCLPVEACKSKKECRTKPRRLLTFRVMSNHQMMLKLDLSQACLQLPVDESSKPFSTNVNTQEYLNPHIYVTSVSPRPWPLSEANGAVLQGIPGHRCPGVACCIHDIVFISTDGERQVLSPCDKWLHAQVNGRTRQNKALHFS